MIESGKGKLISLSDLEKQFNKIGRGSYGGDSQHSIVTLLKLHRKYGWKEQLRRNVESD